MSFSRRGSATVRSVVLQQSRSEPSSPEKDDRKRRKTMRSVRLGRTAGESPAEPEASSWQPIETAPKDGTRIICWGPELAVAECEWRLRWHDHGTGWYRTNQHPIVNPTHWMPLPQPPSGDEVTGGGTTPDCATKAEKDSSSSSSVPAASPEGRGAPCFRRCSPGPDRKKCADESGLMITTCLCDCHERAEGRGAAPQEDR